MELANLIHGLIIWAPLLVLILVALFLTKWILNLRIVVRTDEVHVVQRGKQTVSYGKGKEGGNVYYRWPVWIPNLGITVRTLPTKVFSVSIKGYDAYDKDRVPFLVDVIAFFQIADANIAAQAVEDFRELVYQLESIMQGSIRNILASHDLDEIMTQRDQFGHKFTEAVTDQLKAWGVETVKSLELMDVRDTREHKVVEAIMSKKISHIESDSRKTVAANNQAASVAEIEAERQVELQRQEAEQAVGQRTAEKNQAVGIAAEKSKQQIATEQATTEQRNMDVQKVKQVRKAEIDRDSAIIEADKAKQVNIVQAEAAKQVSIVQAEGRLEAAKREAEGVAVNGKAKGEADTAINLAVIAPQITLAKEIGENAGYQQYLLSKQAIEANQAVGIEQAKALSSGDIKIIANASSPLEGMTKVSNMFGANGGFGLGSMLEGFMATPAGKAVADRMGIEPSDTLKD